MDLELSDRERDLAGLGRRFCEEILQPLEMTVEEHGILPDADNAKVKDAVRQWGLAGINHSQEHGGLGLSYFHQTLIEEQLGRATNGLWTTGLASTGKSQVRDPRTDRAISRTML